MKNLKINIPYDPVLLLLSIYLKACKSTYKREICRAIFIEAPCTITKL
jgi:hypothetical protein